MTLRVSLGVFMYKSRNLGIIPIGRDLWRLSGPPLVQSRFSLIGSNLEAKSGCPGPRAAGLRMSPRMEIPL